MPKTVHRESFEPVGRTIRRVRRGAEDSQEHLAELIGIRQPTLARIEAGSLYPEASRQLANYLGMPIAELRALIERSELEAERAKLSHRLSTVDQRLSAFSVK